MYIVAQRTIADVVTYTIERQDFTAIDDPKVSADGQLCFLDCAKCFNLGAPVGTVSVPHLANQAVWIVGDGSVQAERTVGADGVLVIDPPASVIDVGLPYTSTLKTLPPEVPGGPTLQGARQRWSQIFVRLLNTVGCHINGTELAFRRPTDPMSGPIAQWTEDVHIENLGYDRRGAILIEQRQPLPITVLAVFGSLDVQQP